MAVDISEQLARKGQELREMTRDLDLLRIDVDVIDIVIQSRNAHQLPAARIEEAEEPQTDPGSP